MRAFVNWLSGNKVVPVTTSETLESEENAQAFPRDFSASSNNQRDETRNSRDDYTANESSFLDGRPPYFSPTAMPTGLPTLTTPYETTHAPSYAPDHVPSLSPSMPSDYKYQPAAPLLKYEDIKSVRDVFIYERQFHRESFDGKLTAYKKDGLEYKILEEDYITMLRIGEKYFYDFGKDQVIPCEEDLYLDGTEKPLAKDKGISSEADLYPDGTEKPTLSSLVSELKEKVISKNPNPSISRSNSADKLIGLGLGNEGQSH